MRISDWSSDVCSSDLAASKQRDDLRAMVGGTRRRTAWRRAHDLCRLHRRLVSELQGQRARRIAFGQRRAGLPRQGRGGAGRRLDQGRSEGPTSELQSLMRISYAVFCLKKKKYK